MSSPQLRAFSERFVTEQRKVYGYIVSLVPNRADAEDLFQQTSLTLWEKWEQYDHDASFFHWACAIAHNHIRNFWRTSGRRHLALPDDLADAVGTLQLEREGLHEQRREALTVCMDRLPADQRRIIEQRYTAQRTLAQLAKEFGVSANALYKSIGRIRQALHACIDARVETNEAGGDA